MGKQELEDWKERLLGAWRTEQLANMSGTDEEQEVYAKESKKLEAKFAAFIAEQREAAVEEYIQPHLDLCQQQNGRPYCKNCQLEPLNPKSGGGDG